MPISTTVSMRRYNKEVMLSAGLRAELESSQESIKLAKKKNRDLNLPLFDVPLSRSIMRP